MANLTSAEFKEAVQGKGLDDLAEELKKSVGFDAYRESVLQGNEDSAKKLQIIGMLTSLADKRFSAMFTSVSMDFTYAFLDQKLRAEILQNTEEK